MARSRPVAGRACRRVWCASASSGTKTISAGGGSASVDAKFDPVAGHGACATASGATSPAWRPTGCPPQPGSGYTLMGSPTVVATINSPGRELRARRQAARCRARTGRRPSSTASSTGRRSARRGRSSSCIPRGHLFAAGHVAKLELLPKDAGGSAPEQLRPTGERPGRHHRVEARPPPAGARGPGRGRWPGGRSSGAAAAVRLGDRAAVLLVGLRPRHARCRQGRSGRGRSVKVPVDSAPSGTLPGPGQAARQEAEEKKGTGRSAKKAKKKNKKVLGKGTATIAAGQSRTVKVKLTKSGRRRLRQEGQGPVSSPRSTRPATRCRTTRRRSAARRRRTRSTSVATSCPAQPRVRPAERRE